MKAKWKAKSGFVTSVDKFLKKGKEYTGPDHIVKYHIENGLAEEIKPEKVKKESK